MLSGLIAELSAVPVVQTQISAYLVMGFRRVGGSQYDSVVVLGLNKLFKQRTAELYTK